MFPKYVATIAGQLTAKHLTWREYAQDMGNNAHRDGTVMTKHGPACGHPPLGGVDLTDSTGPGERQLRDPSQPVHVLPIDHRRQAAMRLARAVADARSVATWAGRDARRTTRS